MPARPGVLTKTYRDNFAGGVNYFLGVRQVKDSESPDATNCDFKGATGIGNREGYSQVGEVSDSRTKIFGMAYFRTASVRQAIKFASNGSNVALYHSTGGAWTAVTTSAFTDNTDIDTVQAGGVLYTANGTDVMRHWSGSAWADTTNGTKGYFPEYYDKRLWVVDETNKDTLNFSGQYASSSSKLGDYVDASAGTVTIQPGSGAEITGLKSFKNKLYVFLTNAIYRLSPASAANTFTVELVTNAIGCVSHRSIVQVGEDLMFAADDGVYSLGDVANYLDVRTTNKSSRVQRVYDAISGSNKRKLVGEYFNFKYHLFYSLYGTSNDSCLVFDTRYKGWQDWRNIAANDAVVFTDSSDEQHLYFGEPTTGKVQELYSGTTDDGTTITSTWYSKSFDEKTADVTKLYMHTTPLLSSLGGSLTFSVIFNDTEVSSSVAITQTNPQGGWGRDAFGRKPFGGATNTLTVTQVVNQPQRLKAKGKKFAVQYKIVSSGQWQLNSISQTYQAFDHYKFPSANKLN